MYLSVFLAQTAAVSHAIYNGFCERRHHMGTIPPDPPHLALLALLVLVLTNREIV